MELISQGFSSIAFVFKDAGMDEDAATGVMLARGFSDPSVPCSKLVAHRTLLPWGTRVYIRASFNRHAAKVSGPATGAQGLEEL